MTCTFVIDVLRILYDTVSSRHNLRESSVQCMRGAVFSTVMSGSSKKLYRVLHAHFAKQNEACYLAGVAPGKSADIFERMWLHVALPRL